jgi:hypothetical protein
MSVNQKQKASLKRETEKKKAINKAKVNCKIDSKKVHQIVRYLEGAGARYLFNILNTSFRIQKLISDFKITKKDFCEEFKIKPAQYNDYVKGAFNYTINDMVILDRVQHEYELHEWNKVYYTAC